MKSVAKHNVFYHVSKFITQKQITKKRLCYLREGNNLPHPVQVVVNGDESDT